MAASRASAELSSFADFDFLTHVAIYIATVKSMTIVQTKGGWNHRTFPLSMMERSEHECLTDHTADVYWNV